jgi:hypothetical protein
MCPILLQRSTASIQGLSPQVRFFLSIAASIEAFHYEETLHSLKKKQLFPQ